ncbi:MAG: CocE/NonD family hydrolase [Lentisphaerae bacterium]|nr:CocE/NonD family hydrolase [Lentisphaerota bacterium]
MSSKNQYEVTPFSTFDEKECDIIVRMLPMRDGKKLYTVIYLPPENKAPVGTLLYRSPYFKRDNISLPSAFGLRYGFASVFQCCRGTAWSEGTYFPSHPEFEEHDGEDTLEWISQQPWSNGKVALMGSSYSGWTQWAAAYSGHKSIVGFRPHVAPIYGCCTMARDGGGSSLGFMVSWGLSMFHRNKFGYDNVPDYDAQLSHLPVNEMDLLYNYGVVEFYRDFIRTTQKPALGWEDIRKKFSRISAPAIISGGWFDGFKRETFATFKLMKELAATPEARNYTRLIVGPWIHGGLINKEAFGEENDHRELVKMQDSFILNCMKSAKDDPTPELPTVYFFLMGENRWCSSEVWPPANREKLFYLQENGKLCDAAPKAKESISRYTYDPAEATPSYNGKRNSLGYYDRSATEKRSDVITFTTPVLQEALTIAGTVKVRLFARSSAPDTDFYVTMTDLYPDGRSMFLMTGMVRARFSKSETEACFLKPGEIREYEIDLGDVANTFKAGHAVRIAIHSANFPADSRNLNTTAPINEGVTMKTAQQEIFHDAAHPSVLILPQSVEKL